MRFHQVAKVWRNWRIARQNMLQKFENVTLFSIWNTKPKLDSKQRKAHGAVAVSFLTSIKVSHVDRYTVGCRCDRYACGCDDHTNPKKVILIHVYPSQLRFEIQTRKQFPAIGNEFDSAFIMQFGDVEIHTGFSVRDLPMLLDIRIPITKQKQMLNFATVPHYIIEDIIQIQKVSSAGATIILVHKCQHESHLRIQIIKKAQ